MNYQTETDYLIVGSGAAGATAVAVLAETGASTCVLEEGGWYKREDFSEELFGSVSRLFRDYGLQMARGGAILPVLEGCCVGGSTVINGAILHRLPEGIHQEWCRDEGIKEKIPFAELERQAEEIEKYFGAKRNLADVIDALPAVDVLKQLGWKYQAMLRNAPNCQASGRCLQGCPTGGKLSMERSYIPRAEEAGAVVMPRHRVERVLLERDRAVGVICRDEHGAERALRARRAVVLAAGVLHTPQILRKSGILNSNLGRHFQGHLSVAVGGLLARSVREVEGPPQGIEVTQFEEEGIKLATQLLPPEILLSRSPFIGRELTDYFKVSERITSWMGSVQSEAEGRIKRSLFGPQLHFSPTARDMERVRKTLVLLAELLFELGAEKVFPGLSTVGQALTVLENKDRLQDLQRLSLDPKNYIITLGHLFGTCRMASWANEGVVDPEFKVHGTANLYVVDASVFPTNIGVNPQHAIMAMARHAASGIANQ